MMRTKQLLLVVVILVAATLVYLLATHKSAPVAISPTDAYASCFTINPAGRDTANASCLSEITKHLLTTYTTHELMTDIAQHAQRGQCHVMAHTIGKETFRAARGVEEALDRCTQDCANGCIHGVIGAAVMSEIGDKKGDPDDLAHADIATLEAIGGQYCTKDKSALCHAVGHLAFEYFHTYPDSLASCAKVATAATAKDRCYQGVFMESSGSLNSLQLVTKEPLLPKHTDYAYPCRDIALPYQHACFMFLPAFQAMLFDENKINSIDERLAITKRTCELFPDRPRSYCYEGAAHYDAIGLGSKTFCDELRTPSDRKGCTLGVIRRIFKTLNFDELVNYCASVDESDRRLLCYNAAFQDIDALPEYSDADMARKCTVANNPNECAKQLTAYIHIRTTLPEYFLGLP